MHPTQGRLSQHLPEPCTCLAQPGLVYNCLPACCPACLPACSGGCSRQTVLAVAQVLDSVCVACTLQVKKGQTLAFIEQLGTHWPLESPQVGARPAA